MADKKISDLDAASSAAGTDLLPGSQSGTTRKITLAHVLAYITGASFPSGLAAGRAAAGISGREYYATDTGVLSRDNGSSWDTIAQPINQLPTASGANTTDLIAVSQIGTVRSATGAQLATMVDAARVIPLARVYTYTPQPVADNSQTFLTFTSVQTDTDGMWDGGTPDRLTIQTDGIYLAFGAVSLDFNVTGFRGMFITRVGDGLTLGSCNPAAAGEARVSLTTLPTALSAGDEIRIWLYQNSGSPLNTCSSGVASEFALLKVA